MSAWWSSPTGWPGGVHPPPRASSTPRRSRWWPGCASGSSVVCHCWLVVARWALELPAGRLDSLARSRCCAWPSRCSRRGARRRRGRRVVFPSWTLSWFRLWSSKGHATHSGCRPPTVDARSSRSPPTTASRRICRRYPPPCGPGSPTSLPGSSRSHGIGPALERGSPRAASGRGADRAGALRSRPPPARLRACAESAPSVAEPDAPPLSQP